MTSKSVTIVCCNMKFFDFRYDVADTLRLFAWHVSFNQLMESMSNSEEAEYHLKKSEQHASVLRKLLSASTDDMKQLVDMLVAACRHCVLEAKQNELKDYDEGNMDVARMSMSMSFLNTGGAESTTRNPVAETSSERGYMTPEHTGDTPVFETSNEDDEERILNEEAQQQRDIFEKSSDKLIHANVLTKDIATSIKWLFWNTAWHAVHVKDSHSDRQECFKKIVRHTNELFWEKPKWNGIYFDYTQPDKLTNIAISGLNCVRIIIKVDSWRSDDNVRQRVMKFLSDAESFKLAVVVQFSAPADSSEHPTVAAVREFACRVEGTHKCVQGIAVSVSNSTSDSRGAGQSSGFGGASRARMFGSGFVAAIVQGIRAHLSPSDCAILVEAGELGKTLLDGDEHRSVRLYPEVASLFECTLNEVRSPCLQSLQDCNLVWEFDGPAPTFSNPVHFVQEILDWGGMMAYAPLSCCREWQPPTKEIYGPAFRNELVWRYVQAFNEGSSHGSFFGRADDIPNAFPLYQDINFNGHNRVSEYSNPSFFYNTQSYEFLWRRKPMYCSLTQHFNICHTHISIQ